MHAILLSKPLKKRRRLFKGINKAGTTAARTMIYEGAEFPIICFLRSRSQDPAGPRSIDSALFWLKLQAGLPIKFLGSAWCIQLETHIIYIADNNRKDRVIPSGYYFSANYA